MSEKVPPANGGIGVIGLLGVVFVVLKLLNYIAWSWWWVTLPFWWWVPALLVIGLIAALLS